MAVYYYIIHEIDIFVHLNRDECFIEHLTFVQPTYVHLTFDQNACIHLTFVLHTYVHLTFDQNAYVRSTFGQYAFTHFHLSSHIMRMLLKCSGVLEWWHRGQYFGLPITRSVVQFPLRTLIYALSSSYIEI